jgi:hypothetical protein
MLCNWFMSDLIDMHVKNNIYGLRYKRFYSLHQKPLALSHSLVKICAG